MAVALASRRLSSLERDSRKVPSRGSSSSPRAEDSEVARRRQKVQHQPCPSLIKTIVETREPIELCNKNWRDFWIKKVLSLGDNMPKAVASLHSLDKGNGKQIRILVHSGIQYWQPRGGIVPTTYLILGFTVPRKLVRSSNKEKGVEEALTRIKNNQIHITYRPGYEAVNSLQGKLPFDVEYDSLPKNLKDLVRKALEKV